MDDEKEGPGIRSRIPVPKIQRSASFAYGPRSHSTPREMRPNGRVRTVTQQRSSVPAMASGFISKGPSYSENVSPSFPRKFLDFTGRVLEDHDDSHSICSSIHSRKSSNRLKYAVHCQDHHDKVDEYLTPTQRANRTIKKLRAALQEAQAEIRQKDSEIQRLTKELVELRLLRVQSPPETLVASDSSPDSVVNKVPQIEVSTSKSLISFEPDRLSSTHSCSRSVSVPGRFDDPQPPSLTDSGHYDDVTSPVYHSKESLCTNPLMGIVEETYDWAKSGVEGFEWERVEAGSWRKQGSLVDVALSTDSREWEDERRSIIKETADRVEEMRRKHVDDIQELKEKYNDKLEKALQQLTEANSRYCFILPEIEATRQRLRSAESEIDQMRLELSAKETRIFDLTKKLDDLENSLQREPAEIEKVVAARDIELAKCREEILVFKQNSIEKAERMKVLEKEVEMLKRDLNQRNADYESLEMRAAANQCECGTSAKSILNESYRKELENQVRSSVQELERLKGADRPPLAADEKADSEVMLKFLRSAVFYLLTDHENHAGHLKAVQSILGFSPQERALVEKATKSWLG